MLQKIDNWLKNPHDDYTYGLSVFNKLAPADMKANYGAYLAEGNPNDKESLRTRFPMLINKVTAIYNMVRTNPNAFKDALCESPSDLVVKITKLNQEGEEMKQQIEDLQEKGETKAAEVEQLQEELDGKSAEIETLVEQLEEKGLKVIVSGSELPEEYREKYERTKTIVPLMATIHGELKNPKLADEERKVKAQELCDLDDERRTIWDEIDAFLAGKKSVLTVEKNLEYSDDPLIRGIQMAKRMERLKENIKRRTDAKKKHEKAKKENLVAKAQQDIEAYTQELKKMEVQVNEAK